MEEWANPHVGWHTSKAMRVLEEKSMKRKMPGSAPEVKSRTDPGGGVVWRGGGVRERDLTPPTHSLQTTPRLVSGIEG